MRIANVQSSPPPSQRFIALVVGAVALGLGGYAQAAVAPPPYSAAQAKRGAELYAGSCAMCHGDNLDDGQFAPALKGPVHAAYWRGKTAADLLNYMASTMPPTQPGGLGAQGYADIMAYLLQADRVAPGDKELPSDSAALGGAAPTP